MVNDDFGGYYDVFGWGSFFIFYKHGTNISTGGANSFFFPISSEYFFLEKLSFSTTTYEFIFLLSLSSVYEQDHS
jgi:hypothetical protein